MNGLIQKQKHIRLNKKKFVFSTPCQDIHFINSSNIQKKLNKYLGI